MDTRARKVEELLKAANLRPPGERAAFVLANSDDPRVVQSVLTLLTSSSPGSAPTRTFSGDLQRLLHEAERKGRDEPDLVGTVLRDPDSGDPRWEFLRRLPSSPRSEVYIVIDRSTAAPLVAKTYCSQPDSNRDELRDAFVAEAAIWAALPPHPHIANALGIQVVNGRSFIFVEYFAQGDLAARLRRERLPEPLALWYGVQICDAVCHAYAHGLRAHRDLKPANCLLGGRSLVAVTDFGIGLPTLADGRVQVVGGTPAYMPPEQWASAECDLRSDVYSFAATLYEMLAGQPPFGILPRAATASDIHDLRRRHETTVPDPIPGVADTVNDLLLGCMAKVPSERPRSFDPVRDTLAEVLRGVYGATVPAAATATPVDPAQHLIRHANNLDALGRSHEALAIYNEVLRRNPQDPAALANRCDTLRKLRRLDDATRDGELAVELAPSTAVAWLNLGNAHDDAGRREKAQACYKRAETLDPGMTARLAYERAVTLDRNGRSLEAETAYRLALRLNPDNAMAECNLGQLLRERGERLAALAHFDKAISLNPDLEEAHFNKGCMLYEDERFAEAAACFQVALRVAPDDALNQRWLDKAVSRISAP